MCVGSCLCVRARAFFLPSPHVIFAFNFLIFLNVQCVVSHVIILILASVFPVDVIKQNDSLLYCALIFV